MGNSVRQAGAIAALPDSDKTAYFSENQGHVRIMKGSDVVEIICVPNTVGCEIQTWDSPENRTPRYKVRSHLSHSEFVPRYHVHVLHGGKVKDWIIGHMEKSETHLRCKTGEFVRAQVWNLTSNAMVLERTVRKDSPDIYRPSSVDMKMMSMTIVLQAKRYPFPQQSGRPGPVRYNPETERWVQRIAVDDPSFKIEVGNPEKLYKSLKNMPQLAIYQKVGDGKKEKLVCCARQQRFAGALGKKERPFLGVQIKLPPFDYDHAQQQLREHGELVGTLHSVLDTRSIMLLMICLAWSEATVTSVSDVMTSKFITAMRKEPGDVGSAEDLGLSVQWDIHDLIERLKHVPHAAFHTWDDRGPKEDVASAALYPKMGQWPEEARPVDHSV